MDTNLSRADEFVSALDEHAQLFDIHLNAPVITRLREYYELVMHWNTRLHLVGPCSAAEFATRHVLESLLASKYLPEGARVVDVGSGGGLPIVPCLIARPDIRAALVESSKKKAVFLREAAIRLGLIDRTTVIAERFERIEAPEADYVTCRALERFVEILPVLLEWTSGARLRLLFGGENLREQIEKLVLTYEAVRLPCSARRFLFVVRGGLKQEGPAQKPQVEPGLRTSVDD